MNKNNQIPNKQTRLNDFSTSKIAEKITIHKNHRFLPRLASGTPCTMSFPSLHRGSTTLISAMFRNGVFGFAPLQRDFSQLPVGVVWWCEEEGEFEDEQARVKEAQKAVRRQKNLVSVFFFWNEIISFLFQFNFHTFFI